MPSRSEKSGVLAIARSASDASCSAARERRRRLAPAARVRRGDKLLGRFEVERLAGRGGMSTVYRGRDLRDGSPVAIKVMRAHELCAADRFELEAELLATLDHPAIVQYVAHGHDRGRPVLVMEWLDGEDLAETLRRRSLSVRASLRLARNASAALALAHDRGIVHHDIKPSNLFLLSGGAERLKVLDFGIASWQASCAGLTSSSLVLGTVGYMAPEQARGEPVDARADVFALGCVLYECLMGRPALVGRRSRAGMAKLERQQAPQLASACDEVEALEQLLARLLAKDPDARPRHAGEVLELLDELLRVHDKCGWTRGPEETSTIEQKLVTAVIATQTDDRTGPLCERNPRAKAELHFQTLVSRLGIELVPLPDGGVVLVLSAFDTVLEQAAYAAITAVALREARPTLDVAISTVPADASGYVPIGAVIDRAAALLKPHVRGASGFALDELTASLLAGRFEVLSTRNGDFLRADRADLRIARPCEPGAPANDARIGAIGRRSPGLLL